MSARLAIVASASRSVWISLMMPGRCTLTATLRPSRSVARCTCASEALPSGTSSNASKRWLGRTPSSASSTARICSIWTGATWSWVRSSAARYAGGTRSGRVDRAWPNLMKVGPSASRSATNSSGLPVISGVSPSCTKSRSSPVKTPAPRYLSRKRRIRAVRASPLDVSLMGIDSLNCRQPSGPDVKTGSPRRVEAQQLPVVFVGQDIYGAIRAHAHVADARTHLLEQAFLAHHAVAIEREPDQAGVGQCAEEQAVVPLRPGLIHQECHARQRRRFRPHVVGLLHARRRRAHRLGNGKSRVVDAVGDDRPAIVPAGPREIDLVAAARPVLAFP